MGLAVCAVTDDPKMVRTQFAPKGNGTKRLEAEGLLMGGSTWFTQRGSSWYMPSDNLVPHLFVFMWWTFVIVAIVVPCIGSLVILSYYLVKVIEKSNKKKLTKTSG